ncbi:MAG: N-acyl-D-amino-acid deacylase family protein [Bacillota bacterium]
MSFDLLIKNGTIVDGTQKPSFKGDIAVRNNKIHVIAPANGDKDYNNWAFKKVIDAEGHTVCPGFIDIHSHCDWILPSIGHPALMKSFLEQGVTTIVGGNCGFSPAPLPPDSPHFEMFDEFRDLITAQLPFEISWSSLDSFFNHLENNKISLNLAMLTGHGTVRAALWGRDYSHPESARMKVMEKLITESFEEGSFGLSLGLGYEPGVFVDMKELEHLAALAEKHNRILTVHNKALSKISGVYPIRPFGKDHNIRSLEETISLAEKTGVKLQISHLIFVGKKTWPSCDTALEMIDRARERGVDLAFDSFPYHSGNTTIYIVYPAWFLKNIDRNFQNPLARARLRLEFFFMVKLLGFSLTDVQLMWGGKPQMEKYNGMFFEDIASEMGCPVFEAYLKVSQVSGSNALCLYHKYSGDDRDESAYIKVLTHPLNTIETDALMTTRGLQNPAAFGTFPRVIQRYCKELGVISLEEAIARMTGNSAARIGLKDRGILKEGNYADITIFDYNEIKDNTTLTKTEERPSGIKYVFINGQEVVRDGVAIKDKQAGMVLRR